MHAYSSGNTTCVNVLIDKYANTPHTQTTCTHSVIHTTHHLSTHSSNTHKHMYVRTSRQVLAEKTSYIRTNIHTCVCMYANSHFLSSCVGQHFACAVHDLIHSLSKANENIPIHTQNTTLVLWEHENLPVSEIPIPISKMELGCTWYRMRYHLWMYIRMYVHMNTWDNLIKSNSQR